MRYIENLQSYQDYIANIYSRVRCNDNFIPSPDYDRIITTKIQAGICSRTGIVTGEGLISDNSMIKKTKTILIVDDDKDTTLTVKSGLELENNSSTSKILFQVYTQNLPLLALSEFRPHFYDLVLIDVEMPKMNGFELSTRIVEIDPNPKICFMSAAEVNYEALREIYPFVTFGCFIKKPVSLKYLIRGIKTELDLNNG